MLPEADLVFSEQRIPPAGMRCDSGHVASETFRRNGPDTDPEPTMWFEVSKIEKVFGKRVPKDLGTYCEPCVILARYMATQKKKQETGEDVDPEAVLRNKLQRKK